jgi:hypothetical protein
MLSKRIRAAKEFVARLTIAVRLRSVIIQFLARLEVIRNQHEDWSFAGQVATEQPSH